MSSARRLTQKKTGSRGKSRLQIKAVGSYLSSLTCFYLAVEMKMGQRMHQAPSVDVDAEESEEDGGKKQKE